MTYTTIFFEQSAKMHTSWSAWAQISEHKLQAQSSHCPHVHHAWEALPIFVFENLACNIHVRIAFVVSQQMSSLQDGCALSA